MKNSKMDKKIAELKALAMNADVAGWKGLSLARPCADSGAGDDNWHVVNDNDTMSTHCFDFNHSTSVNSESVSRFIAAVTPQLVIELIEALAAEKCRADAASAEVAELYEQRRQFWIELKAADCRAKTGELALKRIMEKSENNSYNWGECHFALTKCAEFTFERTEKLEEVETVEKFNRLVDSCAINLRSFLPNLIYGQLTEHLSENPVKREKVLERAMLKAIRLHAVDAAPSAAKRKVFITRKLLTKLIGCRYDTIDRMVAKGELPKPIRLGANGRHRFIASEIIPALMKHDIDLERLAMAHGVDLNNPDA
ncbi:hypothetical protein QPK06_05135 [Aeromonas veronii]|uniref:helix-turn-helix transcriptional regulator n=1 Tax=Aeromonas veronii TaxID=654 RepID=UPI002542B21C|nr:hypothetical protein [Aeromonas veronii]WIJ42562.1 hypothetical protein QPK06_05135 [Aeromonas veronii]